MSSTDATPIDLYTSFGFVRNADGTVTRVSEIFPTSAASSDPTNPVLTKDVPINQENNTWARLYLPRPDSGLAVPTTKLPVIVYYNGSGFIVSSAASTLYQKFCSDIVLEIPAVMVLVEYRLAPEHRLPAAYDDGEEALQWLGDEVVTENLRVRNDQLAPEKMRLQNVEVDPELCEFELTRVRKDELEPALIRLRNDQLEPELQFKGPITRLRAKKLQGYFQELIRKKFEDLEDARCSYTLVNLLTNEDQVLTMENTSPHHAVRI